MSNAVFLIEMTRETPVQWVCEMSKYTATKFVCQVHTATPMDQYDGALERTRQVLSPQRRNPGHRHSG
jgi:hypothetical protein